MFYAWADLISIGQDLILVKYLVPDLVDGQGGIGLPCVYKALVAIGNTENFLLPSGTAFRLGSVVVLVCNHEENLWCSWCLWVSGK